MIRVDPLGAAVVLGSTHSADFPAVNALPSGGYPTPGPDTINGKALAFLTKVDPSGSKLVYSTLLWSNHAQTYDSAGMALDMAGNAFVIGYDILNATGVSSPRLTVTPGAYKAPNLAAGFSHVWVAKLSTLGALVWNAVLGGSNLDAGSGIDVDSTGNAYLGGITFSLDFPVTPNNGIQQTNKHSNAFFDVLNPTGSQLVYGTFFGGSGHDQINAVSVIPGVGVSFGGLTTSPDLPVTSDATQKTLTNTTGGFYARLNPPGVVAPPVVNENYNYTTYTSDPVDVIGRLGLYYQFVLTLSSNGKVNLKRILLTEGLELFHSIEEVELAVPDNIVAAGAVCGVPALSIKGYGTVVLVASDFSGKTIVPRSESSRDTTLGVPAVGIVLSYPLAVANAASFMPSAVSPGEIVTLFGNNLGPATLITAQLDSTGTKLNNSIAGTQVYFDNDPAPIVYTSAGQVSVIVPYSVQGKQTVNVFSVYDGTLQEAITLSVAPSAPGIFTADGKQAAALNQDGSYNSASNPAARGSIVVLYATGEGQTNPAGVDGLIANSVYPKPVLPVSVTIGGQPAALAYYGAAPGLTAGLMQLNVVVPPNIQTGNAAVLLTVGTATSQAGVTIGVK